MAEEWSIDNDWISDPAFLEWLEGIESANIQPCSSRDDNTTRGTELNEHQSWPDDDDDGEWFLTPEFLDWLEKIETEHIMAKNSETQPVIDPDATFEPPPAKRSRTISPLPDPSQCNAAEPTATIPCEFAINGVIKKYKFFAPDGTKDASLYLQRQTEQVMNIITEEVNEKRGVKWNVVITVKFDRYRDTELKDVLAYFTSNCYVSLPSSNIHEQLTLARGKIERSLSEYEQTGSGWMVSEILCLELKMGEYKPLVASSYIPLPIKLSRKHAIINIKNHDDRCFLWSVLAGLHPIQKDAQRVSKYRKWERELIVKGIDFPTPLTQITKFEMLNNLSINVFGYEGNEIFPLYISDKPGQHIDLLLISRGEKQHYCLIKNLNRLLNSLTKHRHKVWYCWYCLHRFSKQKLLDEHAQSCKIHGPQKLKFPTTENNILTFNHPEYRFKVPYILYCDFEALSSKLQTCSPSKLQSHSLPLVRYVACGFCYVVVDFEGNCSEPVVYRGEDAVDKFLESVLLEEEKIMRVFNNPKKIILTQADKDNFKAAVNCHLCGLALGTDRVLDHCHISGRYRNAAHNKCNLLCKQSFKIPVVFHNLRGFDSHLIFQGIGKIKNREIKCIANTIEKYISFSLGNLISLDSLQFLNASLDNLVGNLALQGEDKFKFLKQHFGRNVALLLRKNPYPYFYINHPEKFNEVTLPPQSAFFNHITGEHISDADFQHAHNIWTTFNLKNLGDYHNLYIKSDTLQLADIFENFRQLAMTFYNLDPAHMYTSPGVAWMAALQMSNIKLELLTDPNMYLLFERGIRGGVSVVTKRFAKANNKYLDNFDPEKPSNYIISLDSNNLYGSALSQALPVGGFEWLTAEEIANIDINALSDDADVGYIYEVDLDYPSHLHNDHNCFPLAPEKLVIDPEELSPLSKLHNTSKRSKVKKLVPNLHPKRNYIIHYRNLKLYTLLGLQLVKVHKALKFNQRPWLKKYIDFNTDKRKEARTNTEKDFFKLFNNAVFGKTIENIRKRIDVKLTQSEKKLRKLIASPSFKDFRIFNEELVGVHMKQKSLLVNRPIYVGFTVLELSKIIMYEFFYGYIKKKYGDDATLLLTDTDSLCMQIYTEDIYRDMKADEQFFDFSDYPVDHFLYSDKNKKVMGKFKDENNADPISEFCGLRPKMYSIKTRSDQKKRAKGISKHVVKKNLKHADYKRTLFKNTASHIEQYLIQSNNHQLVLTKNRKIGLSPHDDKRYILENNISTLAHGHYKINLMK